MLKIEVIKFEAQDVITASVAANPNCICDQFVGGCTGSSHIGQLQESGGYVSVPKSCTAAPHKCGKS